MGKLIQFKKVLVRDRKPRRMTPEGLTELLMVHSGCVMDQQGKCPMLLSAKSLRWEINQFMNVASEEEKGFKRHSKMLAARPLNRIMECYCEEEPE